MRKPHYWKTAGPASAPSELIVVDTETHYGKDTMIGDSEYHTLRIGCALAYRYEKGKRTRVQDITFRTVGEFWQLVRSRLNSRRPVWVVGHNLAYDLGILNGWKVLCGKEYTQEKVCISGTMFYVKGTLNGCGLNFLDTVNYYHCSLAYIGKSVGTPKMEMPDVLDSDDVWIRYCRNDVEVTALAIENIITFTRKHMLGPFQPTIASYAFAAYRSRFMRENVLVHDYRDSLALERNAYYGGIVDTAYVGTVPAECIYELDVCSMYPSVCRYDLPTYHWCNSKRIGVDRIQELRKDYMVFADVTLANCKLPYPVRGKKGTYYVTGTFRTALAHPELMEAIDNGYVKTVHFASWYKKVPIFKEYMEFFVKHKIDYADAGNDAFANVCKLFANSLYGKCGQQTPKWQVWGKEALQTLEQIHGLPEGKLSDYYDSPPDLYHTEAYVYLPGIPYEVQIRCLFGDVEIHVGEWESRDSCPAIAACVTSYARVLLRSYQRIAGSGHWYYSDTDSIWVDGTGLQRLLNAGCVRKQQLGYLDYKDTHFIMDVHGPKDYATDLVCKRKGIRGNALPTEDGGWEQLQFPGALQQIQDDVDGTVCVKHIVKHLHRNITRCRVLPSGYTRPFVYPMENPEERKKSGKYVTRELESSSDHRPNRDTKRVRIPRSTDGRLSG